MTLQNRVDPFGHIHAVPERGLFMGNRGGCFHRADQTLLPTHWRNRQWIVCVLDFKGRKRKLMSPGKYTELFFLDEATALSSGHRPCYECQRSRAVAFRDALIEAGCFSSKPNAKTLDDRLAGAVQQRLKQKAALISVPLKTLPDGVMYRVADRFHLVWKGMAHEWSFAGYKPAIPRHEFGEVLTPALTIDALRHGYEPLVHPGLNQA